MKKIQVLIMTALTAVFLSLNGCSTINTLGDFVAKNPVFASAASRQAVAAFIATGQTEVERTIKAEQVSATSSKALIYLEGDPEATVDSLLLLVTREINWTGLSVAEQILVRDIINLVELELRKYEVRNGPFTEATKIAIRGLFETAQSAANLYLVR